MNLGERIYRFRTEKNLSQGDLADRLEVSRQSISKWENNNAVPDLEKIIKLSEIFEVSLDELVKGERTSENAEMKMVIPQDQPQSSPEVPPKETGFPPRKIAGILLFCMGFLVLLFFAAMGAALGGIIFASPFVVCGILCFVLKKNVGLWCSWAVYVLFDIYMSYATGISRSAVFLTFRWTAQMNYLRLAFAWLLLLILGVIIAVTVIRLGKRPFATKVEGRKKLIFAWLILIAFQSLTMLWGRTEVYQYLVNNIFTLGAVYRLISIVFSWGKIITLTVALVVTARFIRTKKNN